MTETTQPKPGSPEWLHWRRAQNRNHALNHRHHHNPPAIDPQHPHAPTHHRRRHPSQYHPASAFELKLAHNMSVGLQYAGRMTYSMGADRSMLFGRPLLDYLHAHADCSQDVATNLHWLGVKSVTKWDYTGTLLEKGELQPHPKVGLVPVWGPGTGAHTAVITEHIKGGPDFWVVGFGGQGGPNRNKLSAMNAYFEAIGEPGVRYLRFSV